MRYLYINKQPLQPNQIPLHTVRFGEAKRTV